MVQFWDQTIAFPESKEVYGRWLGPTHDIGLVMTAKGLKSNGQVIYTSTYRPLNDRELKDPAEQLRQTTFNNKIRNKLGEPITEGQVNQIDPDAITPTNDPQSPEYSIPDINNATPEYQDTYIGAEVTLPLQGTQQTGKVKRRTRTNSGDLFGKANNNPILDTCSYDVEFPDGKIKPYTANVIAEHMIAQCDLEGNQFRLMDMIIAHRKLNDANDKSDI